jgi:6-phosphogluconolactonase (cycloisomerase 2 family)
MQRLWARFLLAATLAATGPVLAASDMVIYATAASKNRIDAHRLTCQGELIEGLIAQVNTPTQPRRVVVATVGSAQVLYVGELDRVEAFTIKPGGGLQHLKGSRGLSNMDVRDLAVDGTTLYAIHRGYKRIAAYPLDSASGAFLNDGEFTSCVQGPDQAGFANVAVKNGLLYVSANVFPGRMDVFKLAPDGALLGRESKCSGGTDDGDTCDTDSDCSDGGTCVTVFVPAPPEGCKRAKNGARPPATLTSSQRKKLQGPKAFALSPAGILYVEERDSAHISAFQLMPDGNFFPPTVEGTKTKQQPRYSKTEGVTSYEGMVLLNQTLYATQFGRGRVDHYQLDAEGRLPKRSTGSTTENVRMSPVRLLAPPVPGDMIYVAAGAYDRLVAFGVRPDGRFRQGDPTSQTEALKNAFPNDVAVAVLSQECSLQ